MAVRHPPENRVPPPPRRRTTARVVKYAAPEESFFVRLRRRVLRPWLLITLAVCALVTFSVLGYYYHIFSQRIDRLMSGEIFTRSAGLYTAPQVLHVGLGLSADDLLKRLQRAGYVERGQQADDSRGRYSVNAAGV